MALPDKIIHEDENLRLILTTFLSVEKVLGPLSEVKVSGRTIPYIKRESSLSR